MSDPLTNGLTADNGQSVEQQKVRLLRGLADLREIRAYRPATIYPWDADAVLKEREEFLKAFRGIRELLQTGHVSDALILATKTLKVGDST